MALNDEQVQQLQTRVLKIIKDHDVGEDFEFVGTADIVAVAANSVAHHTASDLFLGKGHYHRLFVRHFAYPAVRFQPHFLPLF